VLAVGSALFKRAVPALPEGTILVAALEHHISTVDAQPGDRIELRTVHPVRLPRGGEVPAGAVVTGEIVHSQSGRGGALPDLMLRFTSLDAAGDHYDITSAHLRVKARRTRVVPFTSRGAGVALRDGASIATDGRELILPAGRRLIVRLTAPAVGRARTAWAPRQVD
jgi:hypothetical protein